MSPFLDDSDRDCCCRGDWPKIVRVPSLTQNRAQRRGNAPMAMLERTLHSPECDAAHMAKREAESNVPPVSPTDEA